MGMERVYIEMHLKFSLTQIKNKLRLPTILLNFQGDTRFLYKQVSVSKVTELLMIKNVRQSRGSWRH